MQYSTDHKWTTGNNYGEDQKMAAILQWMVPVLSFCSLILCHKNLHSLHIQWNC